MIRQIVVATLCSLTHDMLSFDIDRNRIKDLVSLFCDKYKLSAQDEQEIFVRPI